jgi:predicted nucleic acid-binding protein
MPRNEARRFVWAWSPFCTAPYSFEVTQRAWQIQDKHGFNWWDCMLLASASIARCDIFLSEDMGHEQTVAGLIIMSPFRLEPGFNFSR